MSQGIFMLTSEIVAAAKARGWRMEGTYLYADVPDDCAFLHPHTREKKAFRKRDGKLATQAEVMVKEL